MAVWRKLAGSIGSAPSDPVRDQTALAPIPPPAIENKPAPGLKGPKGLSPRTTYSRVNTGAPPVMDAGAMSQKSSPNRGMEFLPAKVAAHRGFMTTMHVRPSLQDMVKAAMAGTTQQLSVNLEATRQSSAQNGTTKTASARTTAPGRVSTELVNKLASALGFMEQELLKEAELGPGEGPNALTVLEAKSSETNLMDAGESGQATSQNQPPKTPSLQPDQTQTGNSGTGLETNDDMSHPEQPVEPIKNASALGKAFAVRDAVKGGVGKAVDLAKAHPKKAIGAGAALAAGAAGGAALASRKKEGSAPIALLRKLAEDAINPAHISSPASVDPAKPPPGASASEEDVPAEPADVRHQKRLIASNEAAINYTKREAKADPKKDVNQVLEEPALTSSTDKVLDKVLDHTNEAGAKIAQADGLRKTAAQVGAQRVVLDRLLKLASNNKTTGVSAAAVGQ